MRFQPAQSISLAKDSAARDAPELVRNELDGIRMREIVSEIGRSGAQNHGIAGTKVACHHFTFAATCALCKQSALQK